MKQKDILNGDEGELKDIKTFHYHEGSISRLGHPDDIDTEAEQASLRKAKEEAAEEDLCPRCLDNSDGKLRVNVKGLLGCPHCGGPGKSE